MTRRKEMDNNMARVKHHNENLTVAQEIFVQELIKGSTQRKAYLKAYPNKIKWKEHSIDANASTLFRQERVRRRYDELMDFIRKEEQEKTQWTRSQSIETLRFVVDKNKEELDRINKASEEELELLQKLMLENPDKALLFVREIIQKKKSRRISSIHNSGIVSAVSELNKMQGFNEETINLNGTVVFTGEDELED